MRNPARCYDPSAIFKPQWAYPTPPGFRDEPFWIPFTFTVKADGRLQSGFPRQLDDDVPWILRAVVFPQIGTGQQVNPALCRITDTAGNPLSPQSVLPVLSLGALSQSGFDQINAFGFPMEPEIPCSPGGTLVFDFVISTNALVAFLTYVGALEQIQFESTVFGTAGNAVTIHLVDTAVPLTPLSVAVVGNAITVTLQDDGGGALVTTYQDLANILNATPAAAALITASISGTNPAEVLTVGVNVAAQHLALGAASTNVTIQGTLLGVKRFVDC